MQVRLFFKLLATVMIFDGIPFYFFLSIHVANCFYKSLYSWVCITDALAIMCMMPFLCHSFLESNGHVYCSVYPHVLSVCNFLSLSYQ